MAKLKVWDGTTDSRKDLSSVKNPDHNDYCALVTQIQHLQLTLNNSLENLATLPNLQTLFADIEQKIKAFKQEIAALIPPENLKVQIAALEQAIVERDTRLETAELRRDVEAMKLDYDKSKLQMLELQTAFNTEVVAFQQKVWNSLKALEKSFKDQFSGFEKKLESLSIQTRIQALIEELKKA